MENQKASTRQKALSLADMASAFVVLGLGVSLAVLVSLFELIYKRINDHFFPEDKINKNKAASHDQPVLIHHPVVNHCDVNQVILPIAAIHDDEIETNELK